MKRIADYDGLLINHLEGLYRPGEGAMAAELAGALGLQVQALTFARDTPPLLSIHPNAEDPDSTSNVIFLTEMSGVYLDLHNRLGEALEARPDLAGAMRAYQDKAQSRPGGIPHFGLRYRTVESLEGVVRDLRDNLSPAVQARTAVTEPPPYAPMAGLPDIRQVFVFTDVFTMGQAGFGQLIELQLER